MSIYDQDTDPSSPDARREMGGPVGGSAAAPPRPPPGGRGERSPAQAPKASRAATTDPGVGPPSSGHGVRASAVVVPPPSGRGTPVFAPTAGRVKDSVELLLEGMGGPRPDRTRTLPQTAGDAAATYHAEHAIRAGHAPHEEDVKVVLVDTVRLPAADEPDEPVRGSADPTFVLPAKVAPRVVVAAIAGLLVVVAIFAYLDRGRPQASSAGVTPPAEPLAHAELPHAAAVAVVAAPPVPEPAAPPSAETATLPPSAVATRPRGSTQPKPAGDVGEFKTSF